MSLTKNENQKIFFHTDAKTCQSFEGLNFLAQTSADIFLRKNTCKLLDSSLWLLHWKVLTSAFYKKKKFCETEGLRNVKKQYITFITFSINLQNVAPSNLACKVGGKMSRTPLVWMFSPFHLRHKNSRCCKHFLFNGNDTSILSWNYVKDKIISNQANHSNQLSRKGLIRHWIKLIIFAWFIKLSLLKQLYSSIYITNLHHGQHRTAQKSKFNISHTYQHFLMKLRVPTQFWIKIQQYNRPIFGFCRYIGISQNGRFHCPQQVLIKCCYIHHPCRQLAQESTTKSRHLSCNKARCVFINKLTRWIMEHKSAVTAEIK